MYRYRAFISYSQRDRRQAKHLHAALEAYRMPKGIEAAVAPDRRLGRFFRDDDEMGASTDLGTTLRGALEDAENLIVVCSPRAARSHWVNTEVAHFQSIGRGDRIFAVIVDGAPNSGDPATECFPPALLSEQGGEPLGVDLRKERFVRSRARLVAGLMGLSFDSLWQREKRRLARQRAVIGLATLILGCVIALLGVQWLTERSRGRAQKIDRALVKVRDDLASGRVEPALRELGQLHAQGERGAVEETLRASLSWLPTLDELLAEVQPPALLSSGPQLLLLASDGSRHTLRIDQPYRRIVSSDRRWLLILGSEAVVIRVADGRELARTGSRQIQWVGRAFETGNGLLAVAGRFGGISNSTFRDFFLVFSPQHQSLSLFDLQEYWDAVGSQYVYVDPLAVRDGCRSFGVVREDFPFANPEQPLQTSDLFFFSADDKDLKPAAAPESLTGWRLLAIFDEELRLGRSIPGEQDFESSGCLEPSGDSAENPQPGLTEIVRPVGLGGFWEPEKRWKVVPRAQGGAPKRAGPRGLEAKDAPCTSDRPCRVLEPEFDALFHGFESGFGPGWTGAVQPRGVRKDSPEFDVIDKELLSEGHDIANAGFISAWCRKMKAEPVCIEVRTLAETHEEETDLDLRSTTGRFVFHARGMARGFRLYDLLTMRNVTPEGPELLASTRWADFSPDDGKLFLAMDRRLLVFAPSADGGRWRQISNAVSVQVPPLPENPGDDAVAGLFAMNGTDLVIVRKSGVVSRFDESTGNESWRRTIGNAGEIERAVVSRNRRFLLVIGRGGARLLDTREGLVLSGVLVPPDVIHMGAEMRSCFQDAFVSDTGAIEVSCEENQYRREPASFAGDLQSRLRAILSGIPPTVASRARATSPSASR